MTQPFVLWLLKQAQRNDVIGDLARDAVSDKTLDRTVNYGLNRFCAHMRSISRDTVVRDIAVLAFQEWQSLGNTYRVTCRPTHKHTKRLRSGAMLGWLKLRFQVFKRDGYRCQLCGRSAAAGITLEIDHKVPRAKGGTDNATNLWTLCFDCNRGKRDELL